MGAAVELHQKNSWTHSFLPTVRNRYKLEEANFWTSQALSGHGVFGAHLVIKNRKMTLCAFVKTRASAQNTCSNTALHL